MKWKRLSSEEAFKTKYFRLRIDRCELPDGRIMPNYYVFEFPDWVNVVPVTEDNRIVLIEQYRNGTGEICLEIPGGSTSSTQPEDPKKAALRELQEETGFVPDDIRLVGVHHPNPALQNNRVHTYVATGCRKLQEQQLDPFEDIRVVTYSIPEVVDLILKGSISQSIIIASIFYALPTLGFNLPTASSR